MGLSPKPKPQEFARRTRIQRHSPDKLYRSPVTLPCPLGPIVVKAEKRNGRIVVRIEHPDTDNEGAEK